DIDVAESGSVEPIAHARVPIIKFVDKLTGLRVDLSFDNDTGTIANQTFQSWKLQYPAMPVIVSVLKQFLLLRGLHEVPTGGIGGFSIICLVTSFLQHLPYRDDPLNLGSLLLDFFDFYGNKFDYAIIGIQFDPIGYLNKRLLGFNNPTRLTILDPNNPDNDVSRGTSEIKRIFRAFSDAHNVLRKTLAHVAISPYTAPRSILEPIIGANYSSYERQREHLRYIFDREPRFDGYRPPSPPPPPPPMPEDPIPPPPPLPPTEADEPKGKKRKTSNSKASSKSSSPDKRSKGNNTTGPGRKKQAAIDRANRLKRLRPELAGMIGEEISVDAAVKLGRYKNSMRMDRDLAQRERQQAPGNSNGG
ncbi:hypothetical protein KEM55_004625, partial [Ascosphaera atra]